MLERRLILCLVNAMGLDIRNDESRQFAHLPGDSMASAITVALRQHLERERRADGAEKRLRDMRGIAERCARLLRPGTSAVEHGEALYDHRGLPS